jgi:uncharacterized NAD-dependent epimerase/dehydratase family protein
VKRCVLLLMTLPLQLRKPYLLFLGAATGPAEAKTAFGIRDWVPEACVAQLRLSGSRVDLGLPDLAPAAARAAGARSLLIGVAPPGGRIPESWCASLIEAADAGLDIVSGMHTLLEEVPGLSEAAARNGIALANVRRPRQGFSVATGRPRRGKRLLTVGTDCALGKKYTALALARAMRARGLDAEFRATGQTGIMIAGSGVAIDAVVVDFVAGAAESLSPEAAPDHWDVIEGQGSLFHPAYAGVTLGLVHGSQPDVMILCHDPTRTHIFNWEFMPLPSLDAAIARYVEVARDTNPAARVAGISLNTSQLDAAARQRVIAETQARYGLPCFDPILTSLDAAVDKVLSP